MASYFERRAAYETELQRNPFTALLAIKSGAYVICEGCGTVVRKPHDAPDVKECPDCYDLLFT